MVTATLLRIRAAKAPPLLSAAVVSVGGLALFLLAATLLISNPIRSTIQEHLLGVDHLGRTTSAVPSCVGLPKVPLQQPLEKWNEGTIRGEVEARSSDTKQQVESTMDSVHVNGDEKTEVDKAFPSASADGSEDDNDDAASSDLTEEVAQLTPTPSSNTEKDELRSCDLYHGKWVYDPAGPLYTNSTCPFIAQSGQNCQANGRPDRGYENWRWKPNQCDHPRFDPRKFLELMRGKTLAFVGDSLARNQLESMLCILYQAEAPKRGMDGQMHQWHFESTSTTVSLLWSAWLVSKTTEPVPPAPQDVDMIHLDTPDENLMAALPKLDVLVVSSGHWFFKPTAFVLKGKVVGGKMGHAKRLGRKAMDGVKAYGIALETALTAIATHPDYRGVTIVRTYSPDHYSGGAWNSGGQCGGLERPASEIMRREQTEVMHARQLMSYEQVAKKVSNGAKLRLMDITEVFGYRHDGHPGPYYAAKNRDSGGMPLSQDCVHWCMPGPADNWNEILFELVRRELTEHEG